MRLRKCRLLALVGVLAEGTFACGGQTSLRETSPRDRGDATVDAGRDAGLEASVDAARDAGTDLGTAPGDDTGRGPFVPAAACVALPEGGTTDAGDAATSVDAGVNADAEGCVDCQPAQVTRVFGGGVSVTTTYPACCSGMSPCGLVIDEKCYPMEYAGTLAPECPDNCCRMDGTCGKLGIADAFALCLISADPQPITCQAASGRHPRACACASCPAEIEACARSGSCTAVVACRAGRMPEPPHDPQGYALADALDACLERAGCMRLTELGVCREACPDGWVGSARIGTEYAGCCRPDGFCGLQREQTCLLYDDPRFTGGPLRTRTGPPPTCRAAARTHPDPCACGSCEETLLECARDPRCIAISECRVETGCSDRACDTSDACGDVIAANGGSAGQAAVRAAAVESCLAGAGCDSRQFGVCR